MSLLLIHSKKSKHLKIVFANKNKLCFIIFLRTFVYVVLLNQAKCFLLKLHLTVFNVQGKDWYKRLYT